MGESLAFCAADCSISVLDSPEFTFTHTQSTLSVTGNALTSLIRITVGEVDCPLFRLVGGTVECSLAMGEAGKHQPVVKDELYGIYRSVSDGTIDFPLQIVGI